MSGIIESKSWRQEDKLRCKNLEMKLKSKSTRCRSKVCLYLRNQLEPKFNSSLLDVYKDSSQKMMMKRSPLRERNMKMSMSLRKKIKKMEDKRVNLKTLLKLVHLHTLQTEGISWMAVKILNKL